MADGSPIEWLQKPGYKPATWNPTRGCSRQGDGCRNCWAINMARRQDRPGGAYEGLTTVRNGVLDWLGVSRPAPDMLDLPLHWRDPRCIFVESMGDLFHPGIPFEYIAACFGVMAATPQHLHIILTKQPRRARQFFAWVGDRARMRDRALDWVVQNEAFQALDGDFPLHDIKGTLRAYPWPLLNVWLLVSAWDQPSAEKYIPDLLECPARVRGVSAEPLLGPMDLKKYMPDQAWRETLSASMPAAVDVYDKLPRVSWVIAGGESGARARPMQEAWALSLRDQCNAAGVAFHFKQWGNWAPFAGGALIKLRSKKQGGRLLDGRTWDEFPR